MKKIYIIFLIIFISCRAKVIRLPYISHPEKIIFNIKRDNGFIKSLKAKGRIYIVTKDFKGIADGIFMLKKPAYIKGTLTYLYKPLFSFSSDGHELFIFDPEKNRLFVGNATKENLNKFLPLSLDLKDLIEIMGGNIPISVDNGIKYKYLEKEGMILFIVNNLNYIWVDPKNLKIVKFIVYNPIEDNYYKGKFDKFQNIDGYYFPTYIEVEIPYNSVKIKIKYKNVELNPLIKNDEFRIIPSKGVKITDLDKGG